RRKRHPVLISPPAPSAARNVAARSGVNPYQLYVCRFCQHTGRPPTDPATSDYSNTARPTSPISPVCESAMCCLRSLRALAIGILCTAVAIVAPGPAAAADPATFPLGMNLAGVADWSSEIIFVDAFKVSRPWISQKEGAQFGMGGDLATNERGWVTKLN